jgi:hypothetical protein
MAEPLAALLQTGPTLAWAIEHLPDSTLLQAWTACRDARVLLRLYARTGDDAGLVRAACACARQALRWVPSGEDRPRLAIEAAEAWARAKPHANLFFAAAYARDAAHASAHAHASAYARVAAARAAIAAVYAVYTAAAAAAATVDAAADNAAATVDAAAAAATVDAAAGQEPMNQALARLADVVRATVSCPDLAVLAALEASDG